MFSDFFLNPLFPRAIVLGIFGGIALILTIIYSRRGPHVYISYAAMAVVMALLVARHETLSFGAKSTAAFAAFLVATALASFAVAVQGERHREELRRQKRLAPDSPGLSTWGQVWRLGSVMLAGLAAAIGIVFVAS